ncbi:MAG: hypothetical protein M0R50_11345 [Candidatus Cloacimonetes bacterium]|nr:hypothetical protein [Candidatus Cloacimonadota bacterium]
MSRNIDLIVKIPNFITKSEVQVLIDGVLSRTINTTAEDKQITITDLLIDDNTTITVELRAIDSSGVMSLPLVYEFSFVSGIPIIPHLLSEILSVKAQS